MTRQHGILSETVQNEIKNKRVLLSEMRREDGDFCVLGGTLHGGDENDNIQKQCKHASCEGLVST